MIKVKMLKTLPARDNGEYKNLESGKVHRLHSDDLANELIAAGFATRVEDVVESVEEEQVEILLEPSQLKKLKIPQLLPIAKELGIKFIPGISKEKLIELILAKKNPADEDGEGEEGEDIFGEGEKTAAK